MAVGLVLWSLHALRRRRLAPPPLPAWALAGGAAALALYWLLRLTLSFALGVRGVPAFPPG